MENPRISILLPTYKDANYIKRAIESVRAQSFSDWELIIVDDGLEEQPLRVIEEWKTKDQRIVYIKNEVNQGIQKSLNRGLAQARGEYIARIDDDDEWIDAEKLRDQVKFLEENKGYVLVGTNAQIENKSGEILGVYKMPLEDKDIRRRILSKNCFLHPSILALKKSIIEAGGYPEDLETKHIEDYALWLRLGLLGKFANLDSATVKITVHSNSLTAQNRIMQAKQMYELVRKYKSSYPGFTKGQMVLFLRVIGFHTLKYLPISDKILYKIQKVYKQI